MWMLVHLMLLSRILSVDVPIDDKEEEFQNYHLSCNTKGTGTHPRKEPCNLPWASVDCSRRYMAEDEKTKNRTYVFLLGYPFTGTSAIHFVLANNDLVSTLSHPGILGGEKEGWRLPIELKGKTYPNGFVSVNDHHWRTELEIPWPELMEVYHSHWNLSRNILLECSPPEIMHPQELLDRFSPLGKVRFILLLRSPCNIGDTAKKENPSYWSARALKYQNRIATLYERRLFVLRFEDACTIPIQVHAALDEWVPGLSFKSFDLEPHLVSLRKKALSLKAYCDQIALPQWPSVLSVELNETASSVEEMQTSIKEFGYSASITKT
eukprot:CAMPEP_0170088208 /NCGR_PEP_ID=MMETSP0019_2-20121128/22508_1 /TAXON_ID=98059 /ORGANISM="Dinobryon sp., Strain UTEXLB2267" /LENGTH=322 /DNA_ID=CAMNT_0010306273 /DNA_START=183 /DNA_END=1151 /DNA_ORIENTATION=+